MSQPEIPPVPRSINNLTGLDYRAEASKFIKLPPRQGRVLIDAHAHITGAAAARVFADAAETYGISLTYTMTQLPHCDAVRDALGDKVRFIAFPTWQSDNPSRAHREGFVESLETFRTRYDARILKLWAAPRLREVLPNSPDVWNVDAPWRRKACEVGMALGMQFLTHVADPDTWFATRYKDPAIYGTKRSAYEGLERMCDDFPSTWVAAHFGGWPEDLDFLDGLLSRHPNLNLDISATKWMVRELSKHPRERFLAFFTRWKDRLLFGSDIVTADDHLSPSKVNPQHPKADQSDSPASAFDLYASRYWALRYLLEGPSDVASPIADPDLKMVDPSRFDDRSSPTLRGFNLPADILDAIYRGNALRLLPGAALT